MLSSIDTIIPIIVAFCATYAITPLAIIFAHKFHLVDDPKKRFHPAHTHRGIIPRAGGLALFCGMVITGCMFLPFTKLYIGTLFASLLLVIIGLLDDFKDVNPYIRLCTNAIAALIVIYAGAGIPFITNPFTGGILPLDSWKIITDQTHTIIVWADLLAFIWIMWTMNIVGWSAGVDGQMPGFVAIAAFFLGLLSLRYSAVDPNQIPVTILAFIVCGAFAGFTPWNFYPQKIMPGYGGKTLAGLLLALLGILSYAKFGTALLVLGIPMVDAVYTLTRRIAKHSSPVVADKEHLHHLLLSIGWGRRKIALFYWAVSAILGTIALTVNSQQKIFTLCIVGVAIGGFVVWVKYFSQFSKQPDRDNG